jgi:hypothetical protein
MIAERRELAGPPWRIDAWAWLVQCKEPPGGQGAKCQYRAVLEIGNPNNFPISFDTILFRFQRLDSGCSMWDVAEQRITWREDGARVTEFYYEYAGGTDRPAHEQERRKEITVPGKRAVAFQEVAIGPPRPLSDPHGRTRLVLSLLRAGSCIAEPLVTQLPPRSNVPRQSELRRGERGYELVFVEQRLVS